MALGSSLVLFISFLNKILVSSQKKKKGKEKGNYKRLFQSLRTLQKGHLVSGIEMHRIQNFHLGLLYISKNSSISSEP